MAENFMARAVSAGSFKASWKVLVLLFVLFLVRVNFSLARRAVAWRISKLALAPRRGVGVCVQWWWMEKLFGSFGYCFGHGGACFSMEKRLFD